MRYVDLCVCTYLYVERRRRRRLLANSGGQAFCFEKLNARTEQRHNTQPPKNICCRVCNRQLTNSAYRSAEPFPRARACANLVDARARARCVAFGSVVCVRVRSYALTRELCALWLCSLTQANGRTHAHYERAAAGGARSRNLFA